MAGQNAMFVFEVVVGNVNSYVESRNLVIRSDFSDIFSLELKDPKQMYIPMPEPPPLPPEPKGKKGKKKPPKKKKGKKGQVDLPPPEPAIQSGQSVLFSSSAEVLLKTMEKCPVELSLWSKEDNLSYIGGNFIPWDAIFVTFLQKIYNCQNPPPVTLDEEYNVFQEGKAKLMAKIKIQIKLTYLGGKVTTAFRTLSEDPTSRKYLYTGVNSKTTSFICTMKTTDEDFNENCNKIENNFIVDKPNITPKIVYADYKNAPGANITFFNEEDYCCVAHADKPPESKYKSPETLPDVDFICDYVRNIITSCNDNMRMLTPRPTIRPRIKATDIDRLCYCKETNWPDGSFAQRFKKEALTEPCPLCTNAGNKIPGARGTTFDIANIRGPCGRPDCKVARTLRAYIEELVEQDNEEINIDDVIGPCGSKKCTLAQKIQEFLRHEGTFSQSRTIEGLSTQCDCVMQMQDALCKQDSCHSSCSIECSSGEGSCEGHGCPFPNGPTTPQVYNVYYFTVELDKSPASGTSTTSKYSASEKEGKFNSCPELCPFKRSTEKVSCSHSMCNVVPVKATTADLKCHDPMCPIEGELPPSPADSDIVLHFNNIKNLCCVKTCDVANKVKDFISDNLTTLMNKTSKGIEDPCYCDCDCTFKFSRKTTYCAICGGYECLGDDMRDQPMHIKPHPCPIYNKLYDRKKLNVPNPWPDEDQDKPDNVSMKISKTAGGKVASSIRSMAQLGSKHGGVEAKPRKKSTKPQKKKVGKFTENLEDTVQLSVEKKLEPRYPYPPVPKNMGWNWTADDIPGMKPRPKWKPGAANKILVRRYRALREGVDILAKKKRALMNRKKKQEMKPTLVVTKHDGEYTVQMEVLKKYSQERLLFQYPYEEKAPLVYTIGKTEEEKRKILKQRERRERRETRRKSRLIQSTFRDKCQEICLKAYNQAIGVLPLPNPNDPDCPCHTGPPHVSPPIDSCSCSEEGSLIVTSDTDNDDWVIEFTPPIARWDAKVKHPPVHMENESQYNYLDYKVKLFDKQGNPIPRYFKGPDGKQVCSDLGGFWSANHVWLEINKDGYIGPDGRWIPMNFQGPDGMFYSAEEGFFTDSSGQNLKVGIDGYIDKDGKWVWYPRRKQNVKSNSKLNAPRFGSPRGDGKNAKANQNTTTALPAKRQENNKTAPSPVSIMSSKGKSKQTNAAIPARGKNAVVMSASTSNYMRSNNPPRRVLPNSHKNNVDSKKLARYQEIMNQLSVYDDLCTMEPRQRIVKTNRACNTPNKKLSPIHNALCPYRPGLGLTSCYMNSSCISSRSETL